MPVAALSSTLFVLEKYGTVAPTTTAPVRQGLGKFGDGLFIEESTTNLVTNPSFETGTTGVSTQGTAPTLATSATRSRYGTQSLLVTWPTVASAGSAAVQLLSVPATGSYAVSLDVYVPAGSVPVAVQAVGGTATYSITTASGNSSVNDRWQRLTAIINVTVTGTVAIGVVNGSAATSGQQVWTDAWQLEQKAYATSYCDGSLGTGYAWTGVANASTSTRAGGRVAVNIPALAPPLTVCAWVRAGQPQSALPRLIAGLNATTAQPNLYYQSGNIIFSSAVDVSATAALTVAAGDVIFAAGTLASDGKTYIVYAAKNGGSVVSASAASATAYTGATSVGIGDLAGGSTNQIDGVIDSFLVFNRVLSPSEIAVLAAATAETTFADDPSIVLAVAAGVVRETVNAATTVGTGSYRSSRSVPCSIVPTPSALSADGSGASIKISVPAGSGIGKGQLVTPNSPFGGNVYTVTRVFSPGGDYDEIYAV